MLLEALVSATCLGGTGEACTKAAQAYYKHKQYDLIVNDFNKRYIRSHKGLSIVVGGATMIHERRATLPLVRNSFGRFSVDITKEQYAILFKRDF
jgi:hypothetical protein